MPGPSLAPARTPARQLSARWLLALGARLVRDVGSLITGAAKADQRLAKYALDGEVRFASAADRAAFVQELTAGVAALVREYDAPDAENGRDHRIVVESRDGSCRAWVRYVHSGILTDDWDNQYDGADKHTDFYLHTPRT